MRNHTRLVPIHLAGAALIAIASGCADGTPTSPARAMPNAVSRAQAILPAFPGAGEFVTVVDNPYFPLLPGTTFEYRTDTPDGVETNTVEVTNQTKTILGVAATVVHDQVFLDGELTEDTFDWYAQDSQGNVWYLGEQSCEVQSGQCVSTEGSWEAGVADAQPGIIMWADPSTQKARTYRQEFLPGTAEDVAKVLHVDVAVTVPYGSFTGCLETVDWSPLEPASREHKFYCPGTGLVLEVAPSGGNARSELIDILTP